VKFDIYICWTNGNSIDASFHDRLSAIEFLSHYQ
jgi:hypothetical protein